MTQAKIEGFDAEMAEMATFARALSHPARIAILRQLAIEGELPCMAIVDALPLSQSACSRHVSELSKVGLIRARTEGSFIFYSLEREKLAKFCQAMSETLHP
jgi:ArsR family transcriptional regulator